MEAVQGCEKLAYEYGNQQIDQPHLLYSLLTLDDSLIMKLVTKMGIQGDMFKNEALIRGGLTDASNSFFFTKEAE